MKNIKCLGLGLLCLSMSVLFACGDDEYSDARKVYQDRVKMMEEFIAAIDKAEGPDEMIPAIETYIDRMEELIPDIIYVNSKFPELAKQETIPQSLKKDYDKMMETAKKMGDALRKILQYGKDPDIQEAMKAFARTSRKQVD